MEQTDTINIQQSSEGESLKSNIDCTIDTEIEAEDISAPKITTVSDPSKSDETACKTLVEKTPVLQEDGHVEDVTKDKDVCINNTITDSNVHSSTECTKESVDGDIQNDISPILQNNVVKDENVVHENTETKIDCELTKSDSTNSTEVSETHTKEETIESIDKTEITEEKNAESDKNANDTEIDQCPEATATLNKDSEIKEPSTNVDSQIRKLIEEDTGEVVVLTVETVPALDEHDGTDEKLVLTVHEEDGTKCEVINEEYQLIDYSQESDGTIIEVISTEVEQTEVTQTYTDHDNNEEIKCINDETNPSKPSPEKFVSDTTNTDNKNVIEKTEILECIEDKEEATTKEMGLNEDSNIKTETCDNKDKSKLEMEIVSSEVDKPPIEECVKQSDVPVNKTNKPEVIRKNRSVIQDIFDDWGVENSEEESQAVPTKIPDSVEIELKSLLDDHKTTDTAVEKVIEINTATANETHKADVNVKLPETNKDKKSSSMLTENLETPNVSNQISHGNEKLNKEQKSISLPQKVDKSSKPLTHGHTSEIREVQPHTKRIVNQTRTLTNQVCQAEVLKERLKEKQKIAEPPRGPDIFFVKKITQRLSSKLASSPINPVPALIPIPSPIQSSASNCERNTVDSVNSESNKESSSDNKELLAILEGDVDPDWSNLKPPTLIEEGKESVEIERISHNTPPKLDPLVEREIALKQLLELPVTSQKRNPPKKKKSLKPVPQKKVPKQTETKKESKINKDDEIDIIEVEPVAISNDTVEKEGETVTIDVQSESGEKEVLESSGQEIKLDESRSGRKRKLTEKAREHEQSTTKRQKVYKGKVSIGKKQTQKGEIITNNALEISDIAAKENSISNNVNTDTISSKEGEKEISVTEISEKAETPLNKPDGATLKRPKPNLSKKGSQAMGKRKVVVKKMTKSTVPANKKPLNLKPKLSTTGQKKSAPKLDSKSQKRTADGSLTDSKPKKKIINEIDRLLQDEGVVNLLYDVEQPDKKRLIPITKSQAIVMDIQKVQRELKIRKKLVRNAVLRLRTSGTGVSKVSPRSKRTTHMTDIKSDTKPVEQQVLLTKGTNAAPGSEFIIPAKIRNAADASVIVRRHSSSSFSSASGSPRVSIDGPDKSDNGKDEGAVPVKSSKRKHSQDEKAPTKKSKKKPPVQKEDAEVPAVVVTEEKNVTPSRLSKKSDAKKGEKSLKQSETVVSDESGNSLSKVVTRSNGTATGKTPAKSKKPSKNKTDLAKPVETDNNEESGKEDDELSAGLAEAAAAFSTATANNKSGNSTANRKTKAATNVTKTLETDANKSKTETRSQFMNKEINVRRHGNLVQLILTPSSTTKIRNALTLPVMNEFRETLSILKKDDECRVVLLTSTGTSFCEGLELSMLLHTNKEERRQRAQEMADAVKDFIKSLASFNKPIVAGVQGAATGLGVTMLPLFDLVIASDKATFCTPYGKLGQIAEGAAVYTLSHILGSAITSELLLGGRTLTASEALRAGLVTRVLWPDRFQVELLPCLRAMSEQSSQSMEATKTLLRHSLRKKLDAALESETYILIQHWCSAECQSAIRAYIDGKIQ